MSTRLYEGISTLWTDNSLGSTFTGGIHFQLAPSSTSYPFVVLVPLANAVDGWTSGSKVVEQNFQLSIFYKEDNSTDPVGSLGTLMRTLNAVFEDASVSVAEGQVVYLRPTSDRIIQDDSSRGVWQGQFDYVARRQVSR